MKRNHDVIFHDFLPAYIESATHVIIKLGTSTLTKHIDNNRMYFFDQLAKEIQLLQQQGKHVLVVSSGAVGFGKKIVHKKINLDNSKKNNYSQKQALASVGQSLLIEKYRKAFTRKNIFCAQILVTKEDFSNRLHLQNLQNTIETLLSWKAVPVFNENDAVATDELKLGDNDTLAANLALMFRKSLLILLSSTDYFYKDGQKVTLLSRVEDEDIKHAGQASEGGTGGMLTKLYAARNILLATQAMVIASGNRPRIIGKVMRAQTCATWFFDPLSNAKSTRSLKRFLIQHPPTYNRIVIDDGAQQALGSNRNSLLLAGITQVYGSFLADQIIEVENASGKVVARGISRYNFEQIKEFLNNKAQHKNKTILHKDQLALL